MTEFLPAEELQELRRIASEWLADNAESLGLPMSGYVTVFDGHGSGWKKDLSRPETEVPGAYAVDVETGDVFLADGFDQFRGAEQWLRIEEMAKKRSCRR